MIDDKQFLKIIESTPLVSIDLIIENQRGDILLGKRTNRPAQNYWFVPGGRIRKNETIAEAIARISSTELGIDLSINDVSDLNGNIIDVSKNFLKEFSTNQAYIIGKNMSIFKSSRTC